MLTGNSSFNDTLVNNSWRSIEDKTNSRDFEANGRYKIDLSKQHERAISLYVGLRKNDASTDGYLYSLSRFYQTYDTVQTMDTVDQRKQVSDHSTNLLGGVYFAEPLWKGTLLGLEYNTSVATYNPVQFTYSQEGGKYNYLIDSLSSDFHSRIVTQEERLNIQGRGKHWNYVVRNTLFDFDSYQKDLLGDSSISLHYLFWLPNVLLGCSLNPQSNLKFNYETYVQLPTIDQLTPKINNSDPLHITIGNLGLKPGTIRDVKLAFQEIKSWMLSLSFDIKFLNNSITNRINTDSLGRQISQPINVNGGENSYLELSVSKKLLGVNADFHATENYTKTINYLNATLNRSDVYTFSEGINLDKYVADKYSIGLSTNFSYFDQLSSINSTTRIHYWTQNHYGGLSIYLIKNLEINTNANYVWQQKTNGFSANTSVLLWNSSVTRNFLRDKFVAHFQINNIFDEKSGIGRAIVNNTYTQTSTNIVGRYWIVSLAYHFDRKFRRK